MSQTTFRKVFVDVMLLHSKDGIKRPCAVIFEDGQRYEIDQLIACKRAAASKVGGTGIRYTIRIQNHQTFLFEDDDKWFVEAHNLHS